MTWNVVEFDDGLDGVKGDSPFARECRLRSNCIHSAACL